MKIKYSLFLLSFVIVLSIFSSWMWLDFFNKEEKAIHIAFVGPLSGKDVSIGRSMKRAIKLYLDDINKQGGINQHKIVLDSFDDQNNSDKAVQAAQDIIAQNRAIAVIGHNHSTSSLKAGPIYKKSAIPAITPASTHIQVTQDNEWYFRMVFNDELQGRFLASYAKHILQYNTVSIISTNTAYSSYLTKVFEEAAQQMEMTVKYQWLLPQNNNLEQHIPKIVSELQTKTDAGLIFLAIHAHEGIKLVKSIKDAGIQNTLMVPDSCANQSFSEGFKQYPKEKNATGYYTNGIYVSTPFILDTANRNAQGFDSLYQQKYHESLPWQAFYALDATIMILEAIKQAKIQGQPETLFQDRYQLKETLANQFNTPDKAIVGHTGLNYFDDNRNALKPIPIAMGIYKGGHLISALNQLQVIPYSVGEMDQIGTAVKENNALLSNNHELLYKTHVVYTGIKLVNISDFDLDSITYTLDFYLWFRFNGQIHPETVEFLNAVEPIQLNTPIIKETFGKETYHLYRVKGRFKQNVLSPVVRNIFFTQYVVGVSFIHQELNLNHLIYVNDFLGMGIKNQKALLKEIQEQQLLNSPNDWTIKDILFFRSILKKDIMGHPKYLVPGNITAYSVFNVNLGIGNNAYAYHALIPSKLALNFLIVSGLLTLLLILISYKKSYTRYLKYLWFVQVIFVFILLISAEIVVGHWLSEGMSQYVTNLVLTLFQMLWWIIPAILIDVAVERFFWYPIEIKTGRAVPSLMRFLISFLIYLFAILGIIAFVFGQPITSLLAMGGVLAGIIGLAVQINLSNIFSGIALSIEHSFRVGDWVKIGAYDEGQVIDMNWRVTKLKTRRQYVLSLPNSVVSNTEIHNFSYPDRQFWSQCIVQTDPNYDPQKIEALLLDAINSIEEGINKEIKPFVTVANIKEGRVQEWIASYIVSFQLEDYKDKPRILTKVWNRIWDRLNRAGIITRTVIEPYQQEVENIIAKKPAKLENDESVTKGLLQNMLVT